MTMMRVDEWKKSVQQALANSPKVQPQWLLLTDRVQWLLMSLHQQHGTATSERLRILNDLANEVGSNLKNIGLAHPLHPAFFDVSSQANKQILKIKSQSAWGQARKIFGPSASKGNSTQGSTRTIQHHNIHKGNPTSEKNYWLEALDPKHRSWGHEDVKGYFNDWLNDSTDLSFWDWLEKRNLAKDLKTVAYLDPKERWKYMCIFENNKSISRYRPGGTRSQGEVPLERFSTQGMSTLAAGQGYAIWVCSPGGIFYTHNHAESQFHHSSFLGGTRILAAGEWKVLDGQLRFINNKTGHYRSTPQELLKALRLLDSRVDLSITIVGVLDFSTSKEEMKAVPAKEFLKYGDWKQCCEVSLTVKQGHYNKSVFDLPPVNAAYAR